MQGVFHAPNCGRSETPPSPKVGPVCDWPPRPPRSTSPEKTRRAGCCVAEPLPAPMYGVHTPPDPNPEREAVQLRTRTQTEDSLQKFKPRMDTDEHRLMWELFS